MPTVTMSFNLPDEREEYLQASQGTDAHLVLWDLDQWLRSKIKYTELSDVEEQCFDATRKHLHDLLTERNVTLV